MDSQKAASWANVGSFFINIFIAIVAIATLGYMVWVRLYPDPNHAPDVFGGVLVNGWPPVIVLALCLFVATAVQIVAFRASRRAKVALKPEIDNNKRSIEIVSPFDGEEVGLYKTVRGHVFPSDSPLQVFVFAGDNKWYAQRHVAVSGTKWSVECQFGNPDMPSAGVYKIAAVLESHLSEGWWYKDLPTGVKSNVITVHRPEITIEQRLSTALKDAQEANETIKALRTDVDKTRGDSRAWERKYHQLTNEKIPVETERDNYKNQVTELRRDFATEKEGHELVLTTERIEKNMLKEDLEKAKRDLTEAYKVARDERNQKDALYQLYQNEKAKYENILWVTDIIGRQAKDLKRHVVIETLSIVRVYLEDSAHGGPRICCGFKIRNKSIFPEITVHWDEVKGRFSFRGKDLTEKAKPWHVRGSPMVDKLDYGQDGWVHLEQDLTAAETDRLKNALNADDAIIGFEEIEIDVSGGSRFPDIDRQTLAIPEQFRRILLKDCRINGNTDNA